MHSYDATIDLSYRDTIKQDKPRVAGSRCGVACYNEFGELLIICNLDGNPVCNTELATRPRPPPRSTFHHYPSESVHGVIDQY